jgi:hypothetical protein
MSDQTNVVTDVRADATKEDARNLGRIFSRLTRMVKLLKEKERACKDIWLDRIDAEQARKERDTVRHRLDSLMDESWQALKGLPAGTSAPGGATPQTVALEMFNSSLNRNLKARMTVTDAKQANRRSFG